MNIEELLTKYTDLAHKRYEAYEVHRSSENEINSLMYDNETPVELKDIEGNATGFTITTPDDLWGARSGVVIAVYGAGWMHCGSKWVSCYGDVRNDTEMFIFILLNLDYTYLVHRGY
jgi:hypothetical protein